MTGRGEASAEASGSDNKRKRGRKLVKLPRPRDAVSEANFNNLGERAQNLVGFFVKKQVFQFLKSVHSPAGGALVLNEYDREDGSVKRKVIVKHGLSAFRDDDIRTEYRILTLLRGAEHVGQLITPGEEDTRQARVTSAVRRASGRIVGRIRKLSGSDNSGDDNEGGRSSKRRKVVAAVRKVSDRIVSALSGSSRSSSSDGPGEGEGEGDDNSGDDDTFPYLLDGLPYFVMEWINGGSLEEKFERQKASNTPFSEATLWSYFLCLTRGCVAMAFPPSAPPNARTLRETIRADTEHSGMTHSDFHLGNVMLGDISPLDPEHSVTEPLKIIDFGMAEEGEQFIGNELEATAKNIHDVGRIIVSLVLRENHSGYGSSDRNRITVRGVTMQGERNIPAQRFDASPDAPRDLKDLALRCLAVEWQDRPTLEELLTTCENKVLSLPEAVRAVELRTTRLDLSADTGEGPSQAPQ
ncbi:hypothetical protein F4778DRAFT_733351 [Xylariomycetidae sp. FL2044]|nr:hypothetical protein F4778DRAFT_733351 [Xylariomycetidae sp. FL2044]